MGQDLVHPFILVTSTLTMTTCINLSLYYEHKALHMCNHETLHTHVIKHYHCHGNILIINSNQPQVMTIYTYITSTVYCMCDHEILHTHVVQCHGKVAYW